MSTENRRPDIVMTQSADIKTLFAVPFIKDLASRGDGLHVNMIGPIVINQISPSAEGPQQNDSPILIPAKEVKGPLLLKGVETVDLSEKAMKQFKRVYDRLPDDKLNATVRLVVETAFQKTGTAKGVSEALNCSIYKARSLMEKYGISS